MVDDVAIDNHAGGVVWWRGGDWVVLTDGQSWDGGRGCARGQEAHGQ